MPGWCRASGAALVTPTSLALIREAYTDPTRRARAIALWAMGGSLGVAVFGTVLATAPAFQHGLRIDLLGTAVLLAATAVATLRWHRG